MSVPSHFGEDVPRAAAFLEGRLGRPDLGVVLGSGFAPLAGSLGAGKRVPPSEIPGSPACLVPGHGGGVAAARIASGNVWLFVGRLHLYEGYDAAGVAFPVAVLAAAGARTVVLTCAAGGLLDADQSGDFAVIFDHLNLTGTDPLRSIPPEKRDPPFLDLQGAYDSGLRAAWHEAARETGTRLRDGVLASVAGPCYETPAEVRMARSLGADLVSMSTALEAIAARYLGLRVAAIACVANRGAGMQAGEGLSHDGVLSVVERSVAYSAEFLERGCSVMIRS